MNMKTTTTAESATTEILKTFNSKIVNPNKLLENMKAVKKALPQTDEYKHAVFAELIEILQGFLKIHKFNNYLFVCNGAFKRISTVACVLCDKKVGFLMRTFIKDVIDLLRTELEDLSYLKQ